MAEPASSSAKMYGRLLEGAHVAGYTFERACSHLEWLLMEDRWKLDGQFDDVNKFLKSIKLGDELRPAAEQRKRIAKRIKELQPDAALRSIAEVVGWDKRTVGRDLNGGAIAPADDKPANEIGDHPGPPGANAPPRTADLSGAEAAKIAGRVSAKNQRKEDRRQNQNTQADTCSVEDLQTLIDKGARFGTIYADPPWLYDNQGTRAATGNHYDGLTIDELCALPIKQLAADDAHLHLWTTNAFLFECPRLFEAWGFEFRSTFIWVKRQMGIGNYWRNSHEILLTAIRGDAKRFNDHSMMSWLESTWIECDRGAHSAKPEQVRHKIEKASPGPYLELFGRTEAEGWTVWGNEVRRSLLTSWNTATAAE